MARMTENAENKFYSSYERLVGKVPMMRMGSPERTIGAALASLSQGLGAMAIALRQVYDKLEEIDKKLPKR